MLFETADAGEEWAAELILSYHLVRPTAVVSHEGLLNRSIGPSEVHSINNVKNLNKFCGGNEVGVDNKVNRKKSLEAINWANVYNKLKVLNAGEDGNSQ